MSANEKIIMVLENHQRLTFRKVRQDTIKGRRPVDLAPKVARWVGGKHTASGAHFTYTVELK